ncbi:MAG: threonine--tRNA ligase [Candidatus Hodarchaeales archaeon]|jgi:threonyl-tRNA synthetase
MQLLLIHSQGFRWKANDKAVMNAESFTNDVREEYETDKSVVVVFIAVEITDPSNTAELIPLAVKEIHQALNDIGETRAILYPWVHLAKTSPSKPSEALNILQELREKLQQSSKDIEITRAPFGYYKSFSINCKGHALAERSKEISMSDKEKPIKSSIEVTKALSAEDQAKSTFFVLDQDGIETPHESFHYKSQKDFQTFVKYETDKDRSVSSPPKHVEVMKNLELVDYEEGSDAGNFRILPRGYIVKQLIENHVINMAAEYGAMIVETPLMYSYEHPSLKKYLERFPARQYVVKSGDKDYFLRFAACFGQFLIMSDATISYRQFPLKIFEMAKSFRREQRGELAGIRRLRTFTMPDLHTVAIDLDMAKREFEVQFKLAAHYMRDIEVSFETAFRMTTEFYNENKEWISSLIRELKKPILLEIFDTRYAYFILKFEFNIVDGQKKAAALSTVQIDVENSDRFNITYTNEKGQTTYPLLLHCSLSGSTERVIYGILEDQLKKAQKGVKPQLPLWLSPTQVRILPVSEDFLLYSEKIAEQLEKSSIRVEIDDRDLSLGRKIRSAEKLWSPLILVIGQKEVEQNMVSVRFRKENKQEFQSLSDVENYIKKNTVNRPFFPRVFPKLVSKQPIFTRLV